MSEGFKELIDQQVSMLREGQVLEALDLYFSDYGVMYSNGEKFGEGIAECRKKQEPFLASAKNVKGFIKDLIVDEYNDFCAFRNCTSFEDSDGKTHQIDGVHIQMWAGGKIATEWYYNGNKMDMVIGQGVLSNPAHILEIT